MTVVVGVDGSAHGRAALRWAATWADASESALVAATSWQYPRTAALPGGPELAPPELMDDVAANDLRTTVVEELGTGADRVTIRVERGPAAWALLEVARREDASLLVVGTRGLGALGGRLLGSVSRRVAECATCPVAIVPVAAAGAGPIVAGPIVAGPIVVGVDGSPGATRALDWAIGAAGRRGLDIVLVHGLGGIPAEVGPSAIDRFVDQAKALVDRHAHRVSGAGLHAVKMVRVEDPRHLIRVAADEYDATAVVLGSQGDGPVSGMLIGSVVTHVAQHSDHPVVIVPEPPR
jgi:nucleotide-binding universal stress UspA family protein